MQKIYIVDRGGGMYVVTGLLEIHRYPNPPPLWDTVMHGMGWLPRCTYLTTVPTFIPYAVHT